MGDIDYIIERRIVNPPDVEPVTVEDARRHLRIAPGDTSHDDDINAVIPVARQWAEQFLRRALITQTWQIGLSQVPPYGPILMPFGRLQQVNKVEYRDEDGNWTEIPVQDYWTDAFPEPGVVSPVESWPTANSDGARVAMRVEFVCGYGDEPKNVPEPIRHAILIKMADLFANRESIIEGVNTGLEASHIVRELLFKYRVYGAGVVPRPDDIEGD